MSLCVLQPWSAKLLWSFVSVICYAECRWCGLRRDLINGFERFCTVYYWWVYRDNAAINSHNAHRDRTNCRFSPIPLPCSINMRSDLISICNTIPDGFSSKRVWCACRRSFSGKWVRLFVKNTIARFFFNLTHVVTRSVSLILLKSGFVAYQLKHLIGFCYNASCICRKRERGHGDMSLRARHLPIVRRIIYSQNAQFFSTRALRPPLIRHS